MVGQITSILSQNKTPDLANSLDNREADDNDSSRERGFAGIYHQNIDALDAAKSGIDLPPKDQALPASAISPDGLKSNALSGDITLPASAISTDGLKSKTLKGGTALILGGLEPSQEGLAEYAKAQGIDADLLSLLMSDIPSTPDNFSSIVSNAKAGTDLSMLGSMTQVSANLSPESGVKPGQATSVMDMSNIAHDVKSADLLGSMKQASTDIAASLRSMTKVSVSLSPESGAKPGQATSVMDMSNIAHDVKSADLLGSMKQASTDIAASLRSMTKVSVSLSPESGAKPGQAKSVMDMSNIAHDVESANLLGSMKQASTDIAASLRSMTKVSVSLSPESGVKPGQAASVMDMSNIAHDVKSADLLGSMKQVSTDIAASLRSMTKVSVSLSPESGVKPGQATSVMDMSNIAHDVKSADLLGSMKQASTDIAASLRSMTKVSVSLSPESGAKPGQATSVMDMSNIAHDVESADLLGSMKQASTDIAASLRSMTKVSVSLSPESGVKPGQATSVMDMSNIAHDVESADLLGSMKQASTDIAASLRSMTKVSVSLSTEDGVKKDQPSSFIAPNLRASTVNLDGTFKADTRSTAVQGGLSKLDTSYSSGDSAETLQIRSSLSQSVVSTENMLKNNTLQMIGKPDLSLLNSFATDKGTVSLADALQKATIETGHKIINNENSDVRGKTSQAIVDTKVMFERMQTAVKSDHLVVKLPPIDLLASTSRVLESADVNSWTPSVNLVKTLVAGEQGSALLGQAATAELRSSAASVGVDVETLVSAEKGLLSRQEQYLDLSRRLTDALGQRLTSQIQKGAWQVEFDLHPKSLGRIEIQLEMKNGELEAYFNASKLVTRDLLQESMAKLKDELGEHGIETAYVGLSSGNNAKSDENSTASEDVKDQALVKNGDKQQASIESHKSVSPNDGLDISV